MHHTQKIAKQIQGRLYTTISLFHSAKCIINSCKATSCYNWMQNKCPSSTAHKKNNPRYKQTAWPLCYTHDMVGLIFSLHFLIIIGWRLSSDLLIMFFYLWHAHESLEALNYAILFFNFWCHCMYHVFQVWKYSCNPVSHDWHFTDSVRVMKKHLQQCLHAKVPQYGTMQPWNYCMSS